MPVDAAFVALRIGIDFDNTIAGYDEVFYRVATSLQLIPHEVAPTKSAIKTHLLTRPNGDLDWQRLQGQVYGKHMLEATVFPGVFEFLHLSKLRGARVFVVSHKSEFGHFDEDRVPLRDRARQWLHAKHFFDPNGGGLNPDDVYFESTRERKIQRIRDLGCTHFIDDLAEVFDEATFPATTRKFLFAPTRASATPALEAQSWRQIAAAIHSPWTEVEICRTLQARHPALAVRRASLVKGRGNSRIYALSTDDGDIAYALKIYPDRQYDARPRLETEFAACRTLAENAYPVAEAVVCDPPLGWGVYRWIAGQAIEPPDADFISHAIDFVARIHRDSRAENFAAFPLASEACLSGGEIVRQIRRRLTRLVAVDAEDLAQFIDLEFTPHLHATMRRAEETCGATFERELPREWRILSPSDFGSHNALRVADGRDLFFDFEYFGWDDPVKLVADFYWHPAMSLDAPQKSTWLARCTDLFQADPTFALRLRSFLPLYGLRWCLIVLNESLPQGAAQRLHAAGHATDDLTRMRAAQLDKAKTLLQHTKEILRDNGSTLQRP